MTNETIEIENKNSVQSESKLQLATFRLSGRLLGVNILDVKEVCDNITITPIHHAPQKVCGYMNIRGQILLVIDLRTDFGFEAGAIKQTSKVVVFKDTVDEPFGIIIDTVGDVVEINEHQITDRRDGENMQEVDTKIQEKRAARIELCKGVCPLEDELVLILNSKALLE